MLIFQMACTEAFRDKMAGRRGPALTTSAAKGECRGDACQIAVTSELCMHIRITTQVSAFLGCKGQPWGQTWGLACKAGTHSISGPTRLSFF